MGRAGKVLLLVGGVALALLVTGVVVVLVWPGLPLGWETAMQAKRLSLEGLNSVQDKYLEVTADRVVTESEADALAELLERTASAAPAPRVGE